MKPILFDKNSNTFTTNGIGRLSDAISCIVTEERNGQYELEMHYPETGSHASAITLNSIICAIPFDGGSLQPFRVYKVTKPINGQFSIYAQHISYQLSLIPTMPFSVTADSTACNTTLQTLKTNAVDTCPFTFWTDVTTIASYSQTIPSSIRSRLGGIEGSVLDQFGGEYEWDGYTVKLHAHRGVQNPTYTLRYGKNITDLNQEQNIADVITSIVPYWADSEGGSLVVLPEKRVDSSYASSYPFKRDVVMDFSSVWEEAPTVSQLRTHAQAYVNKAGIGIPKVSIQVSFVHLSDTEEYKDIAPLQHVKLCDEVAIEFEKYDISTSAKVVKTIYDVLADRYQSIELGSVRSSLASTISDTNSSITELSNNTTRNFAKISNELQEEIDNATAWLTDDGGVIRALKNADGEWTDLLCMSLTATATSGNVLRLNSNGIGFSSTGWNGTYTQAWTLDGRLVIGGTNVPSITVYDSNSNIIFQADATAMIWNATNSSMSSAGVITATGAQLNNATINGGSITTTGAVGDMIISSGGLSFVLNNTEIARIKCNIFDNEDYLWVGGNKLYIGASDTEELRMNGDKIGVIALDGDVTISALGGEIKLYDDTEIGNSMLYGDVLDPSTSSSGFVKFSDLFNGNYHNTRVSANVLMLDNNYLAIAGSKGSSSYDMGYTGTICIGSQNGSNYAIALDNGGVLNTWLPDSWIDLQVVNGIIVGGDAPANLYTITFDANGGEGSVPSNIELRSASATSDTTNTVPTRSGYKFYGWSATPQWSTNKRVAYNTNVGGEQAPDGTTATLTGNWNYSTWCTKTGGSSSNYILTLYAQWYEDSPTPVPPDTPVSED